MRSKNIKIQFFCLLICFVGGLNTFSQSSIEKDSVAVLSYAVVNENTEIYSFKPLMEYNEFKTSERVIRMNSITGDNASVEFIDQKIFIRVNSNLTKDENLERLLKFIVRLHGYSTFELN